jgi:DUF1680 family protein
MMKFLESTTFPMKQIPLYIFSLLLLSCGAPEKQSKSDYPYAAVGIRNVSINDSFWLPLIDLIQDTTIGYAFRKSEEEGRMENFLIAGKQLEGKTRGKMPFDDTDLYKIIEGAALSLISKPNADLETYLDSMIALIAVGQEADGYLTTWFSIDRMNPPASWVKPAAQRWEQEVSSHELYNSGHLFEAAAAHHEATGKRNFLEIALRNADLLVENFGPDKLAAPPGHQIVETGLIRLYRITGRKDYLDLARFFLDARGDSTSHKLYGAYSQDHLPVAQQREAVGHAVRAVYQYAAMTDIAALQQDPDYHRAINLLWDDVVGKKMYLTGGIGAKHEGESFGEPYELPNLTGYNETCAAIGNVYWNHRLFLLTGNSKYYDVIERTLYNGLISGVSADGRKFFYPNPLESDGVYPFNQGACTRSAWFDCSCCPTNLIRFIPSLPGLIYATHGDSLFVNLYLGNRASMEIKNHQVEVIQRTDYPWAGKVSVEINPESTVELTLKLRVPGWAGSQVLPGNLYRYLDTQQQEVKVFLNRAEIPAVFSGGYLVLQREWNKGDQVELVLPMQVRQVVAAEHVEENRGKVAFEYGPLVYCGEEVDNPQLKDLEVSAGTQLTVVDFDLAGKKIRALKGRVPGNELNLIPYYLWSNRQVNRMKVWFPLRAE